MNNYQIENDKKIYLIIYRSSLFNKIKSYVVKIIKIHICLCIYTENI